MSESRQSGQLLELYEPNWFSVASSLHDDELLSRSPWAVDTGKEIVCLHISGWMRDAKTLYVTGSALPRRSLRLLVGCAFDVEGVECLKVAPLSATPWPGGRLRVKRYPLNVSRLTGGRIRKRKRSKKEDLDFVAPSDFVKTSSPTVRRSKRRKT